MTPWKNAKVLKRPDMQPKHKRLIAILIGLGLAGGGVYLILSAFQANLIFFVTPTDLQAREIEAGQQFRIGGLVEEGSLVEDGLRYTFSVTDLTYTVPVRYEGLLPDLFDEGEGVVIEGSFGTDGVFDAASVLAKHDETYMPAEVADALRASGQWQGPDD